jgi:hypothetical protein
MLHCRILRVILRRRHAALLFPKFLQSWSRTFLRAITGFSQHFPTRPSVRSRESFEDSPLFNVVTRPKGDPIHVTHPAVTELAQQPTQALPATPTLNEQWDGELSRADELGIQYVQSFPFAHEARVAGCLIKAEIGPISHGYLYGTELENDERFVTFEPIGFDTSGGYDIVRSATSVAYVIVTYASHARDRGMNDLKDHIETHPDSYAVRALILRNPWPHTQAMIDRLVAGWTRRLAPSQAQNRLETLNKALAELKRV